MWDCACGTTERSIKERVREGQPQIKHTNTHSHKNPVNRSSTCTDFQLTHTNNKHFPTVWRYLGCYYWDVEVEKAISLLPLNQSHAHIRIHTKSQIFRPSLCLASQLWVCNLDCISKEDEVFCVFLYVCVCDFSTAENCQCGNDCSHWGSDSVDSCVPPPPLCVCVCVLANPLVCTFISPEIEAVGVWVGREGKRG